MANNASTLDYYNQLKDSVTFNMSLSSKELFHSNILAYLAEIHPAFFKVLFKIDSSLTIQAKREENHTDISIFDENKHCILIIENKVKSLPYPEQLEEYKNNNKAENYLLLSMYIPGNINETTCPGWEFVSYSNFSDNYKDKLSKYLLDKEFEDACNNHNQNKEYLAFFLNDYGEMLSNLAHCVNSKTYVDYDGSFKTFPKWSDERMDSIRIHDVLSKIRYCKLAEKIYNEIKDKDKNVSIHLQTKNTQFAQGAVYVNSNLLLSGPLVECRMVSKDC